jgi:hypothetical protein
MEPERPGRAVWLAMAALMIAAWALIIWLAMEVARTALEALQFIMDLARGN